MSPFFVLSGSHCTLYTLGGPVVGGQLGGPVIGGQLGGPVIGG